jgi:hypothetical protein
MGFRILPSRSRLVDRGLLRTKESPSRGRDRRPLGDGEPSIRSPAGDLMCGPHTGKFRVAVAEFLHESSEQRVIGVAGAVHPQLRYGKFHDSRPVCIELAHRRVGEQEPDEIAFGSGIAPKSVISAAPSAFHPMISVRRPSTNAGVVARSSSVRCSGACTRWRGGRFGSGMTLRASSNR